MPKDSADADLAGKILDFLEMNKLDRFYRGTIKDLAARLPKRQKAVRSRRKWPKCGGSDWRWPPESG